MHLRRCLQGPVVCAALLVGVIQGQKLQHRSSLDAANAQAAAPASSDARLALPAAAEGEYRWGEPGEVIELYVEGGRLRGYLTRRSERKTPGSASLTFAFIQAETPAAGIDFLTRHIHGDWYSFHGKAVRGLAKSAKEEGYYLLEGTLTIHLGPVEGEAAADPIAPITKQVSLKLAANSRPQ